LTDVRAILEAHGIRCLDDAPSMPCPDCKQREICDDCAARLARVRVRAAIESGKQGEMF